MRVSSGNPCYTSQSAVICAIPDGLELIEIAPCFDIQRDIVSQMGFAPVIKAPPRLMDERIFRLAPMGLRSVLLRLKLSESFSLDAEKNMFFINFEGLDIATHEDVEAIYAEVESRLSHLLSRPQRYRQLRQLLHSSRGHRRLCKHVSKLVSRFYSGLRDTRLA